MLATLASNRVQGMATAGERVLDILFGCFQLSDQLKSAWIALTLH